jgi:pimeloyl-ACP methyl ester carboxylesterase
MKLSLRPIVAGLMVVLLAEASAPLWGQAAAPQVSQLRTSDGVQLTISYYKSTAAVGSPAAKQVTPVIMLHDFKDTRAIFGPLAARLLTPPEDDRDRPAFAVVTVDLRGHGDSTKQIFPNGFQQDLDAAKLKKDGIVAMAGLDMEEVRRFLVTKNDEGAVNLNKLCIIGAGMGATVGANWAVQDWLAPPLAIGKQGQDVKALVLVSPRWSYQGLTMLAPLRLRPLKQFAAWMLLYGSEDAKVEADVRRIEKQLKPFHSPAEANGGVAPSGLVVLGLPSKLQGDKLLTGLADQAENQIVTFLFHNVAKKDQPWIPRSTRLP